MKHRRRTPKFWHGILETRTVPTMKKSRCYGVLSTQHGQALVQYIERVGIRLNFRFILLNENISTYHNTLLHL